MTSNLWTQTLQAVQVQDEHTQSVPVSPTSSTSDSVFSGGDARSSQSSAPSSVKGSPLTYDSLPDSDVTESTDSVRQQFSQASLTIDSQDSQTGACVRRHPRRTQTKTEAPSLRHESAKPVPSLVRQCDRKELFVEALVDTTTEMIEVVWPLSKAKCSLPQGGRNILDLRKFVQEVLRRSKTSHSTLQVALFYLMLLIPFVPKPDAPESKDLERRALMCGRRMFLAALILASKYLQDRNYSMSAWARISGLKKEEICFNELAVLKTLSFDLHVSESKYKTWTELVINYSVNDDCRMARTLNGGRCDKWRAIVPRLTADLTAGTNSDKFASAASTPLSTSSSSTPAPSKGWTPPASPYSSASERSNSPMTDVSVTPVPPPQFLEPKVRTPADNVRFPTSPILSKLETPCLPPISFDCTPAASRSQRPSKMANSPAIVMALKQAQNQFIDRTVGPGGDARPCNPPRRRTNLCRRSGLSQCSSSSGDSDYQDWQTLEYQTPAVKSAARESFLRASRSVDVDETMGSDSAARILTSLRQNSASSSQSSESPEIGKILTCKDLNAASPYPSPPYPSTQNSCRLNTGSSLCDLTEEARTPRVGDPAPRLAAPTASKRKARPSSMDIPCDYPFVRSPESMSMQDALALPRARTALKENAGMITHRNGAMVDYSAGVEDVARSRASHYRSTSGSRDGARKKPRPTLAHMLR